MSISDEIQQAKDQIDQLKAAVDCRARLNGIYTNITALETKVNYYKANTGFDLIPAETKAALNRIYQMCLTLKGAIEADQDFEELINY